jgi:hypothetical protein
LFHHTAFDRLVILANIHRLLALLRRLVPTQARTKEKKQKQYKTEKTLPLACFGLV